MSFENNVYKLINALSGFQYRVESLDKIWDIIFPDHCDKYHYVRIIQYQETYYFCHISGDLCALEVHPGKEVKVAKSLGVERFNDGRYDPGAVWDPLILSAQHWLKCVNKNWIKANKQIYEHYPLAYRFGTVPHALVRDSLSDIYNISKELGKAKTKKFIKLVETCHLNRKENTTRSSMSANDYFDYCRIAYIAAKRKDDCVDESLTGREMYERYADGRHNGLLDIDPTSEQEFADWIDGKHPKKNCGGHPWEIKRGGNTTHISLSVSRPYHFKNEDFEVVIRGASIGRLKESICMFLALYDAGLPITIADPEDIRQRLLAQDNIGIIPSFDSLHRANQRFGKKQTVYDVLHYAVAMIGKITLYYIDSIYFLCNYLTL